MHSLVEVACSNAASKTTISLGKGKMENKSSLSCKFPNADFHQLEWRKPHTALANRPCKPQASKTRLSIPLRAPICSVLMSVI